jgi:hypothetical protein
MEPDIRAFPPPTAIPPSIFPTPVAQQWPNLSPLTETGYHDKSLLSSIMSLTVILEAIAGTVTLLSAPRLLDRVLNHLCTFSFPFSLVSPSS